MTSGTLTVITNTWHFSSFMNPELEISFCFIGRLWGVSDMGSIILSGQLSWQLLFPGFARLLWGFLASSMTKVQLHRPAAQREMPQESIPGMAAPPGSVPSSLWSWALVRLGSEVRLPNSPTSVSVINPKSSFPVLCLCTWVLCVFALGWSTCLKHALLRRWLFHVGSGECSMFMILFKSNLNPSLLTPDSQNQKLPLEIFLCKTRL